jgi:hypothetical protein
MKDVGSLSLSLVKKSLPKKSGNSYVKWRYRNPLEVVEGTYIRSGTSLSMRGEDLSRASLLLNRGFDINEAGYAENLHLQTCK